MRVGVIQSSFIPWRGYFDFIASVDLFIFHDDLQYTKGDWRNRNRIKTSQGSKWLTVPVSYHKTSQLICETCIDNSTNWRRDHQNQWHQHYAKTEYFEDVVQLLRDMGNADDLTISQLNVRQIRSICAYLAINTPLMFSSDLKLEGTKTDRLIQIMKAVGGKIYLSGPSADDYLDKALFKHNGMQLEYKSYEYDAYPQLWGDFDGAVTVLDLIANCGPNAQKLLRSRSPNIVVELGGA